LGFFLSKRLGTKWSLFGIGAVTFIASQVVHLPLLQGLTALFKQGVLPAVPQPYILVFNAAVLGLAAGLCEGLARYLVLRFWAKSARTWREALMFGAGHGGIEAIILGLLAGLSFVNMVALRTMDLATLPLSASQAELLAKEVTAYWSAPWYGSVLGAVERVLALCLHLSAAVLVMQVFTRKNILWLGAAILWHALGDALTVFAAGTVSAYQTEAVLAAFAVASLVIIFALRPRQPEPVATPAPSVVVTGAPASPRTATGQEAELRDQLDKSKFAG
jgi:uncharacterized membrane protein YhfC